MSYSSILVAIDINDANHARSALKAARFIKKGGSGGTKVHIFYVRYFLPHNYEGVITSDFDSQERTEALNLIAEWQSEFGLEDATVATHRGRVRDQVLDEAAQIGADLIIIGSRQPSLSSRLLGSNAAAIARNSPVSVLIARFDEA